MKKKIFKYIYDPQDSVDSMIKKGIEITINNNDSNRIIKKKLKKSKKEINNLIG